MSDSNVPSAPSPEPAPNPATPPPVTSTAPSTTQPASGGTGLAPNVAAGLAAFFSLIGSIVFLVLEKKDQYVRFWAMQSVIFGGACVAFEIVVMILVRIPFIGWLFGLLSLLVWLGIFVVWLITVI